MTFKHRISFWTILCSYLLIIATLIAFEISMISQTSYLATKFVLLISILVCGCLTFLHVELYFNRIQNSLDAIDMGDFSTKHSSHFYSETLETQLNNISQKYAERHALKTLELNQLKALVRMAPIAILSFDHTQKITQFNQAAERLFKLSSPNFLCDLNKSFTGISSVLLKIQPSERVKFNTKQEELPYSLVLSSSHWRTSNGEQRLVTIENIGRELVSAEYQAWRKIIGVLTHEMMNSITPIISLANTSRDILQKENLFKHPRDDQEALVNDAALALETIEERSSSILKFVDGYRKLSQLPNPELEQLSVSSLFNSIERFMVISIREKNIDFITVIKPESLKILADKVLIEQALLNLIKNAVEACHNEDKPSIELSAYQVSGHTIFSIKDNGCGMSEHTQSNMFSPFFSTKKNGSGIGLALTQQTMNAHGGQIIVNSSVHAGTQIQLWF